MGDKGKRAPQPHGTLGVSSKHVKIGGVSESASQATPTATSSSRKKASKSSQTASKPERKTKSSLSLSSSSTKVKIIKLQPARPFPSVPTSVNPSTPHSSHHEGKNYICITRHTPLGAYLSRCKDVLIQDGYKTLHLHAMGAAIPHLCLLATSLPSILPFRPEELLLEYRTGTSAVLDEIIHEDEEEDTEVRTRDKSTLSVVFHIVSGDDKQNLTKATSAGRGQPGKRGLRKRGKRRANGGAVSGSYGEEIKVDAQKASVRIVQEPDQNDEHEDTMDSS